MQFEHPPDFGDEAGNLARKIRVLSSGAGMIEQLLGDQIVKRLAIMTPHRRPILTPHFGEAFAL
jgi:hypothetical protein